MVDRMTRQAGGASRRPTMRDVAALAGVGIKTVSRVVNGEPFVSETMAQRVWAAVHELDYHVDERAGSLRRTGGATRTIALLVSNVANPFAGELHRGVEDVAVARDVAVLASSLDEEPEREIQAMRDSVRRHVDGVILDTVAPDADAIRSVLGIGVPVVLVDRAWPGLRVDSVTSDTREAAARATRHLLAHGHRRIAMLTERLRVPTAVERRDGFLLALAEAGVSPREAHVVSGVSDAAQAERALTRLLGSGDAPTAVFSGQNLITVGAVRALHRNGLQHSIALVGFDDLLLADVLDPPLTVVRQHPRRIGRLAAERLFARLDGEDPEVERIIVPTELVVRGSGEIRPPSFRC